VIENNKINNEFYVSRTRIRIKLYKKMCEMKHFILLLTESTKTVRIRTAFSFHCWQLGSAVIENFVFTTRHKIIYHSELCDNTTRRHNPEDWEMSCGYYAVWSVQSVRQQCIVSARPLRYAES